MPLRLPWAVVDITAKAIALSTSSRAPTLVMLPLAYLAMLPATCFLDYKSRQAFLTAVKAAQGRKATTFLGTQQHWLLKQQPVNNSQLIICESHFVPLEPVASPLFYCARHTWSPHFPCAVGFGVCACQFLAQLPEVYWWGHGLSSPRMRA